MKRYPITVISEGLSRITDGHLYGYMDTDGSMNPNNVKVRRGLWPLLIVLFAVVLCCSSCSESNYHHTGKSNYHYPANKKHEKVRMNKHCHYISINRPDKDRHQTSGRPVGMKRR